MGLTLSSEDCGHALASAPGVDRITPLHGDETKDGVVMREATIAKYCEAVREARAFKVAYSEEPTPARAEALRLARDRVRHAEGALNGSALGRARRLLTGSPGR